MDKFLDLMFPDDDDPSCSPLTPIATLAFIDLETTGLPGDVGKKNVQITELAIVAVDRTDFEEDLSLRVANKLTLFIRPRTSISVGAMDVSKLYNDVLERQKPFDETVPKMIELFFQRLRSPICLLAHNGKAFDFPVLRAELKRIGFSLPPDVTCADTLEAFRTLGRVPPNGTGSVAPDRPLSEGTPPASQEPVGNGKLPPEHSGQQPQLLPSDNSNMPDMAVENMLSDKIDDFRNFHQDVCFGTKSGNGVVSGPQAGAVQGNVRERTPENQVNCSGHCSVASSCECPKPKKQQIDEFFPTRKRPFPSCKRELFPADQPVKKLRSDGGTPHFQKQPPSNNRSTGKRAGFSLEKLYAHYFGELPPKSHHADSDCINLCRVVQKVSDILLPWLDENQSLFAKQPLMW